MLAILSEVKQMLAQQGSSPATPVQKAAEPVRSSGVPLRRSNGAGGGGRGAPGILASGLSDGDEAQVQCADGLHEALPPGESRLVCWLLQEQEL